MMAYRKKTLRLSYDGNNSSELDNTLNKLIDKLNQESWRAVYHKSMPAIFSKAFDANLYEQISFYYNPALNIAVVVRDINNSNTATSLEYHVSGEEKTVDQFLKEVKQ
jgi:hypothetical protein